MAQKVLEFTLGDRGLNKVLERRVFAKGALIFEEGHNAREAFVILRGEVEIISRSKAGEFVILTTLNKGQLFGELALMADRGVRLRRMRATTVKFWRSVRTS